MHELDLIIREASTGDAAVMAALHAKSLSSHWSEEEFIRSIKTPGTLTLVAQTDEGLCGFIMMRGAAGEAEILTLAVSEPFRRMGLGTALTERALGEISAQGAREIFLEVAANNSPAKALYEALGFDVASIRKGYYQPKSKNPTDALVMRRALA